MRIESDVKLDLDDVLIRPNRSNVVEEEVTLQRNLGYFNGVPVVASNMETTGTFEVANVLEKYQMMTCIHKNYDLEELYDFFFTPREFAAYSMGISDAELHKWNTLKSKLPKGNIRFVCIDEENAHSDQFLNFIENFKKENQEITLIAGNVVTEVMVSTLIHKGVDIVKVGMMEGAVGCPQLSAVIDCAHVAHEKGARIMADGGARSSGDVAKLFAAGADYVMLNTMFAGHEESGGETFVEEGQMLKTLKGDQKIPFKGKITTTVEEILSGLRKTCTFIGAKELREISKCTTFLRKR